MQLAAEFPHIGTHNHWVANKPGSTLFVPISDQVETLLNLLWIYTGEGSPVLDAEGKPFGKPKPLLKEGHLHKERAIPLTVIEAVALKHTTSEITIAAYNIQLALQAIGLGGWLYTGINAASLLGAYAEQGTPGFGFRYQRNSDVPEDSIPVGLDGVFEPLIPPYVTSMADAAERFLDRKFGKSGVFGAERPSPYLRDGKVKKALASPLPEVAKYFVGLVQDILRASAASQPRSRRSARACTHRPSTSIPTSTTSFTRKAPTSRPTRATRSCGTTRTERPQLLSRVE